MYLMILSVYLLHSDEWCEEWWVMVYKTLEWSCHGLTEVLEVAEQTHENSRDGGCSSRD
jgi:hypothetical protein